MVSPSQAPRLYCKLPKYRLGTLTCCLPSKRHCHCPLPAYFTPGPQKSPKIPAGQEGKKRAALDYHNAPVLPPEHHKFCALGWRGEKPGKFQPPLWFPDFDGAFLPRGRLWFYLLGLGSVFLPLIGAVHFLVLRLHCETRFIALKNLHWAAATLVRMMSSSFDLSNSDSSSILCQHLCIISRNKTSSPLRWSWTLKWVFILGYRQPVLSNALSLSLSLSHP